MSSAEGNTDELAVWGEGSDGWEREPDYMLADLAEDIGDQINALMNQEGVTRAQLAERIGHSAAYVTQLLGGASNFQLKTLIKLALALDAHVHVNFDRELGLADAAAERYRRWAGHAAVEEGHEALATDSQDGAVGTTALSFTVSFGSAQHGYDGVLYDALRPDAASGNAESRVMEWSVNAN